MLYHDVICGSPDFCLKDKVQSIAVTIAAQRDRDTQYQKKTIQEN